LWPWQMPLSTLIDRHGAERVIQRLPVTPMHYTDTIADSQWLLCIVSATLGVMLVAISHWLLERTNGGGR
jgi:hypothetical protein